MPPTVKKLENDAWNEPLFSVDLEGSDEFNIKEFDSQLATIAGYAVGDKTTEIGFAKFIVVGSNLIVFPTNIEHIVMHTRIKGADTYKGKLVCAGTIEFDQFDGTRVLSGHSSSLADKLDVSGSEQYKREVLQPKLGPDFQVR